MDWLRVQFAFSSCFCDGFAACRNVLPMPFSPLRCGKRNFLRCGGRFYKVLKLRSQGDNSHIFECKDLDTRKSREFQFRMTGFWSSWACLLNHEESERRFLLRLGRQRKMENCHRGTAQEACALMRSAGRFFGVSVIMREPFCTVTSSSISCCRNGALIEWNLFTMHKDCRL